MEKITVYGGQALQGQIKVSGAKNAALPILAATLLISETIYLYNIPDIQDIRNMIKLLEYMGAKISYGRNKNELEVNSSSVNNIEAPYDLVRKMRASILVLGPLLARFGEARVSLPGGCAIGTRPVDIHLKALSEMGVNITVEHGFIHGKVRGKKLKGTEIHLDKVSVGATENIIMAAILAKGVTTIYNAAKEPEIIDLCCLLRKAGAKIDGDGTDIIKIDGVDQLNKAEHILIADRIEAGTYAIAAAITRGELLISSIDPILLQVPLMYLTQCGVEVTKYDHSILVKSTKHLNNANIITAPYPEFPTDLQAQMMALLCTANGESRIIENIFENRFMHVSELNRMGANIKVYGNLAIIEGRTKFSGAEVMATDLRASVALILAALSADKDEKTTISRVYHLERGYENIVEKLKNCGSNIEKTDLE